MKEYSPYDSFFNAYRRVWLVALLTIFGGLTGLFFQRIQPPVFEAYAIIELNVDLTQSDFHQVQPLTELEQDQSIAGSQAVIASHDVLETTLGEAQARQLPVSAEDLVRGSTIFLERKHAMQILRVRHRDPQVAAELANLWSETAYQALAKAHGHATRARFLKEYLTLLENCPTPEETSIPGPGFCELETFEALFAHIQAVTAELHEELLQAGGVIPAMRFDLMSKAEVPSEPVAYRSNWFVFSGSLLGFIAGAGTASIRLNSANQNPETKTSIRKKPGKKKK